jgi:hypothetical protein
MNHQGKEETMVAAMKRKGTEVSFKPLTALNLYTAVYRRYRRKADKSQLASLRSTLEARRCDLLLESRVDQMQVLVIEACKEALVGATEYRFEVVGIFSPRQKREYPETILKWVDRFVEEGLLARVVRSYRAGNRITALIEISW